LVTIGFDTSPVNVQLRAREEDKRNNCVVSIIMSAYGAMGPSMVAFEKEVYGRVKEHRQIPCVGPLVAVVLGHALEHGVHGDGRCAPGPYQSSFTTTLFNFLVITQTMRHTRRGASLPPLERQGSASIVSESELSAPCSRWSRLCFTAPYLASLTIFKL